VSTFEAKLTASMCAPSCHAWTDESPKNYPHGNGGRKTIPAEALC
jgi:hypothetical protein